MDKKDLKAKRLSIRATLSNLTTNLALAKEQNNYAAQESIKRLIDFCEKQLKALKEH